MFYISAQAKGFCQVKTINVVHVSKKKKYWIKGWVGGVWLIRVFLGFFFFLTDKISKYTHF